MREKLLLLLMSIAVFISCGKEDEALETKTPKVDFSYEIDLATKTVTLTNKSVAVENYNWFFSDGEKSSEESPKHTFKSEGTFEVTLSAKVVDSEEMKYKTEEIVVGDPNGHKPMAILQDAEGIDFAGFTIKWTRKNPQTRAILNLQISKDKNFETILKTERVDHITEKLEYKLTDLDINTQYWYRMQIKYTVASKEDIYYSEVKSTNTVNMPEPSFSINNAPSGGSSAWFEIVRNNIKCINLYSETIKYTLEVSRDEDFNSTDVIKINHLFDTYLKEPNTTFYIRYTAEYKGETRSVSGSEAYSFKYIASLGNSDGLSGNYTKKFIQNAKTMLEFGVEDGARAVIQIKNFNGVGKYPLKYNINHFKDEANSINTVDDSYAYYLDGKSAFKYYLSRKGISLNVYRETADAFYCTIISDDDYNTLQFRQSKLDVRNGDYYSLHSPYFVIMK